MSMLNLNIATSATEARDKFFKLLRLAGEGKDVIILKNNLKFKLSLIEDNQKGTKRTAVLNKMANTNFKSKHWESIESIIETRYKG